MDVAGYIYTADVLLGPSWLHAKASASHSVGTDVDLRSVQQGYHCAILHVVLVPLTACGAAYQATLALGWFDGVLAHHRTSLAVLGLPLGDSGQCSLPRNLLGFCDVLRRAHPPNMLYHHS